MTPIPTQIKEAVDKEYPFDGTKSSDFVFSSLRKAFTAGATHPETERYYINIVEKASNWALENNWAFDGYLFVDLKSTKTANFIEIVNLYRQSLTNKNKEG